MCNGNVIAYIHFMYIFTLDTKQHGVSEFALHVNQIFAKK